MKAETPGNLLPNFVRSRRQGRSPLIGDPLGGGMIPGVKASLRQEEAIRSAFASWADHFRGAFNRGGLTFLVDSYERLIAVLETGRCEHASDYASCCADFYEFTNDLSVRDAIQIVLDAVSETERSRIMTIVSPMDERYRRTQVGTEFFLNPEARARYPEDKFWWYYGLPRGVRE